MRCPRCSRPLITFRLNPARGRVEPFCPACNLTVELPPSRGGGSCPQCGLDFTVARAMRLLGCERCYDVFAEAIHGMLQSRRPDGFLFQRESPSSLALSRMRILQDVINGSEGAFFGATEKTEPTRDAPRQSQRGLSLRIRLARNIPELPYPGRMSDDRKVILRDWLFAAGSSLPAVLADLLSTELVRTANGLSTSNGMMQVWSGDEDHLRLSLTWILDGNEGICPSGLVDAVLNAEEDFLRVQEALDREFFWQARPRFGYLAACPSNTGSGRRVSLQFSTHGLEMLDSPEWLKWGREAARAGFELRGSEGEGSSVNGRVTLLIPDELPGLRDRENRRQIIAEGIRLYDMIRRFDPILKKE